jgi:hypothetical protein
MPYGLTDLGGLAAARGDFERAARLLAAGEVAFEATGAVMDPGPVADFRHDLAATREALGEAAFERAWQEGRSMDLERAVAFALGETDRNS